MSTKVMANVDLRRFVQGLIDDYPVLGPRAKGLVNTVFDRICDPEELALDYVRTILPPKKCLFPPQEALFQFSRGSTSSPRPVFDPEAEPQAQTRREPVEGRGNGRPTVSAVEEPEPFVLFGVHPCDLHAIAMLDRVLLEGEIDTSYLRHRSAAILMGLDCMPDEECFCRCMGTSEPSPNYDLFLTDLGEVYLIEVGSERGRRLLFEYGRTREAHPEHLARKDARRRAKAQGFSKRLDTQVSNLPLLFQTFYRSSIWAEKTARCFSCGSCNIVCPTCFCFDVLDRLDLSLSDGERLRRWDGCLLPEFALVASGENFRGEGVARYRHRFFRKFQYLPVRYRQVFCVGCGRCSRACIPRIADPVETINAVLAERGYVSLTPVGSAIAAHSAQSGRGR